MKHEVPQTERYKAIGAAGFARLPEAHQLSDDRRRALQVVSRVLPFRVNRHVIDTLIDWAEPEADPIFRLLFPAREMLSKADFSELSSSLEGGADPSRIDALVRIIRARMNPHPSGQMEHNVPIVEGEPVAGLQHKYRETVLYFPARGQTCHAYCNFCFRWAQFVGDTSLKFASKELERVAGYLGARPGVTDLLITGGDPMIMASHHMAAIFERLSRPDLDHVQTIRIGTKSLTFWPQRFVSDGDADALLRSIEATVASGKRVAIMMHVNHWREIDNPIAREAIRRLRDAGASLYSQAPLLAGINDSPDVWTRNWTEQIRLGIQPYYMFVERDTGARHYFEVPLVDAVQIFREAVQKVSGLARTVHGPVMSADPGKVELLDAVEDGEGVRFLCQFLQARVSENARRPFYLKGTRRSVWYDDLSALDAPPVIDQAVRVSS